MAVGLAGLALGSAALLRTEPAYLEPLAWLFFFGALVFLGIAMLVASAWVGMWGWRYFNAVDVRDGDWFSRYWPLERIAQVSGVSVDIGHWAGKVTVYCQMEFTGSEHSYIAEAIGWSRSQIIEFPQQPVDLTSEPTEGDKVAITVSAKPAWWRGRPSHRTVESRIGITDHRATPPTGETHTAED